MKLRVQGDSLRLRLGGDEVRRLAAHGRLEEVVHFAPGVTLTYALQRDARAAAPSAGFADGVIEIRVPAAALAAQPLSIGASQPVAGRTLAIIVEEDLERGGP